MRLSIDLEFVCHRKAPYGGFVEMGGTGRLIIVALNTLYDDKL